MESTPWFLLVLLFGLAVNVAAVDAAVKMWRPRRKTNNAQRRSVILGAFVALFTLGLCGTTVGVIKAFGAVGGESIDPSQKARILAEGISEAMNLTALGALLPLPVSIGILIYAAVVRRRAAK